MQGWPEGYSSKRVSKCLESIATTKQGVVTELGMQMILFQDSKEGDTVMHLLAHRERE